MAAKVLALERIFQIEMERTLKAIFKEISQMDHLPTYQELKGIYLPTAEVSVEVMAESDKIIQEAESTREVVDVKKKAAPKPKAKPKKGEDEERGKCEAKTAKGTACKNLALTGCCYCRVHQNKFGKEEDDVPPAKKGKKEEKKKKEKKEKKKEEPDELEEEEDPPAKKGKGKTAAAPKKNHTHPIDEEGEDCEECDRKGDVAKKLEDEFEEDPDTNRQLQDILDQLDGLGEEGEGEGEGEEDEEVEIEEDEK
jgi:hypothetical protein